MYCTYVILLHRYFILGKPKRLHEEGWDPWTNQGCGCCSWKCQYLSWSASCSTFAGTIYCSRMKLPMGIAQSRGHLALYYWPTQGNMRLFNYHSLVNTHDCTHMITYTEHVDYRFSASKAEEVERWIKIVKVNLNKKCRSLRKSMTTSSPDWTDLCHHDCLVIIMMLDYFVLALASVQHIIGT